MRRALVPIVAAGALLAPIAPASAEAIVVNVADHILTVTGTSADEGVTIGCDGGEVTVNQGAPDGGPEPCASLRRILVFAEGGADRVSLGEVTPSTFERLSDVTLDGGPGDDTLIGSGIGDVLQGGGGIDELRGGGGSDLLAPGPGSGALIGGKGHDTASVQGDSDWGVDDQQIVRTGPDQVVTMRSVEAAVVVGGRGDNTISGASFSGSLFLSGQGGDDKIQSGSRHDELAGGDGSDFLDAGPGNDLLKGGAGSDALRGGEGNDQLLGGPGNDTCDGGLGADSELSC